MKDTDAAPTRKAAEILVHQLVIQGVDTVFCVPGESYLAVLDALHDTPEIRLVVCRHEGTAAMMAEAHGKLTARPGVVFVSRGPGVTNGCHGLHIAAQDSTPMLMFIGQNPRDVTDREAFQEVDYRRMLGQMSKAVWQVEDGARMAEYVTRAVSLSLSGRPGPVVLALPEDMLTDTAATPDGRRAAPPAHPPAPSVYADIAARLARAERPLILVGGGDWSGAGRAALMDFAERAAIPCIASFRRQDRFDNTHPNYAGELGLGANPALLARVKEADTILVLGARMNEICMQGYTLMDLPCPAQELIHVYPDADVIGRVYQPELAIQCRPGVFAEGLAGLDVPPTEARAARVRDARDAFEAWTAPRTGPGDIQMTEIMGWLDANTPADTIWTNGAGNFSVWLHRFHRYRDLGTQLAPVSGSMGYGVPAAISAKLARPEATVICIAGDGDFQMSLMELSTAAEHGLAVRILILNNGMYGTIRMHQEREYPGRVSGTGLHNPDFVALARSYGAYGERVERTGDFAAAFTRADAHPGPAVLELMIDPEAISPNFTLSELTRKAQEQGR